jgi:hypothetical protein
VGVKVVTGKQDDSQKSLGIPLTLTLSPKGRGKISFNNNNISEGGV